MVYKKTLQRKYILFQNENTFVLELTVVWKQK